MSPTTSRRLRIAAVVVAGLALLLVAGVFIVSRLVDVNTYAPTIQKKIQESTGREVTFGNIEMDPFPLPTIVVHDVVVKAPQDGSPPWLEAEALRVRVHLGPLLAKRIEVAGIAIDKPTVRVLRAPDGRINLQTLVDQKKDAKPGGRVSIGSLAVRGGRVLVSDAFVHPGKVEQLELAGVDLHVPDLSARPIEASVTGQVEPSRGSFKFDGKLGPGNDLAGTIESADLDLAAVSPWLEALSGMADVRGRLTSDIELTRSAGLNAASGKVAVTGLQLPVALTGAPPLDASLDVDVTSTGESVELKHFELKTGSTALAMTGTVATRDGAQSIELDVAKTKLRPADVVQAAAALGIAVPSDVLGGDAIDVAGKAQIQRAGDPRRVTRILLDGFELGGAKVVLRRNEQGRWLLPGGGGGASAPAASGRDDGAQLAARNVKLRDVSVLVDDRKPGGFGRIEAEDVSLTLASYAAGKPGPFELSAKLAGGRVAMKGELSASGGASSVDVDVQGASLAQLKSLMGSTIGGIPSEGTLTWRAKITGDLGKSYSMAGTAKLEKAKMALPDGREVVLDLPVEHDVTFEEGGIIRARTLVVGLPGGELPLSMQVEPTRWAVATKGETTLSPESLRWLLAMAGSKLPFGFESEEPVKLDARLAKIDGKVQVAGNVAVSHARVTHSMLPAPLDIAKARVALEGDRIDVDDAALRLGESTLAGKLSVRDFESPRLTFDLSSPAADLDELFAMTGSAKDAPSAEPSGPSLAERMRADGRLRVDRATFGGIEMTSFDAKVALADGVLSFDPATLELYGGGARSTGRFDLRGGKVGFDVDLGLTDTDVGALLVAGVDYREFEGKGDATARLRGTAGGIEQTLGSLSGNGEMSVRDGVLRGLNAMSALKKASVFGEQSLAALGDRLAREGTPFSTLAARYTLDGGTMRVESLTLATPDGDIAGKGTVNLLSRQMDMDLRILFSEPLSAQMKAEGSKAAELFWDAGKDRVSLPARLTGPMASPSANIDYSKAAAQAAKGRLGDLLADALGGGGSRETGSGGASPGKSDSSGGGGAAAGETKQASGTSVQASSMEPPSGELQAGIESLKFGGPVLAPDLKIRAWLSGVGLDHGTVVVTDDKGKVLSSSKDAFRADVSTFYSTASRDQPARIPVKLTVDGKTLLGAKTIVVKVTAVDASGASSGEASSKTQRSGLF